jgi:hypothetical protein
VTVLGRFPLEKLTKLYSLDQINQAAQDSEKWPQSNPSFAYHRRERRRNSIVTDHKSRLLPQAMSFPSPTSDLNRTAVYK